MLVLLLVTAQLVRVTKPWDDLQTWRWYTMMFESFRAELFTHWEAIQHTGALPVSTAFRKFPRDGSTGRRWTEGGW